MWKKRVFNTVLLLGCFIALERFCHTQTRGFSLQNIYPADKLPLGSGCGILPDCCQPFTFLDSGLEFYAFLSADKQHVLKFFKQHHVKQADFLAKCSPLFNNLKRSKRERLKGSFASCKIAFEELQEETGLLYLHLAKTDENLPIVTLIDKLGIAHRVALDELPFLVQKRAEKLLPRLEGSHGKEALSSLLQLIRTRCAKGVADRDPTLLKNFGFVEGKAVVIDLGSFSKDPFLKAPNRAKVELFYETLPLRCLLTKKFPDLLPHFTSELNRMITEKENNRREKGEEKKQRSASPAGSRLATAAR